MLPSFETVSALVLQGGAIMTANSTAGIVAGVFALAGGFLYILAILGWGISVRKFEFYRLKNPTRPNRVTWLIWSFVGIITVSSYYASGATHTVWFAAALTCEYLVAFALSYWYGDESWKSEWKHRVRDFVCLGGAAISAFLWWWFDIPQIALFATIAIDLFGAIPTMAKAYTRPWTEDRRAWTLAAVGSVINMYAMEWKWEPEAVTIAIYPIYMLVANGLITILLYLPRRKAG